MIFATERVDLAKVCRLCLYQGCETDIMSIYNNATIDLPNKIKECVSLEIDMKDLNNKFPTVICFSCLQQLNQWSNFRNTCHQTHNILLQSIQSNLNSSENTLILQIFKNESIGTVIENKNNNELLSDELFEHLDVDIKLDSPSCGSLSSDIELIKKTERRTTRRCVKTKRKSKRERKKKPKILEDNCENNSNCNENSSDELEDNLQRIEQEFNELELRNKISKDFSYECDICNCAFGSIFEYLDHQETHNGEPVFKCHRCTHVFSCRKDLVEHDLRHQIPCPKCGKLVLPGCLRVHMVLHTDKYKCTECNWCFSNSTMLRHHIESVHIRLKTHVCETCGKSFTSTSSLQTHIKIHSDVRPYACKICDYTGRTASALYTHMARHENGLHVCEICAKSFKSFRSLRDHTRRVHNEKKNHECGICQKKFVDKYMLTVHTRTHTGARPYECTICKRTFVRSDGLKEHLATHGQRDSYNCQQCGKKFIYRRSLGRHTCIVVTN